MNKKLLIKIFVIILLFPGGYFLYKYLNRPDMTIIIKYKEVPPVVQRFPRGKIDAYYRGYNIGIVEKIRLSQDQQSILFYLDIYYKNLKLPKNTRIYINSEDLYGARHLYIQYPKKPSSEFLHDGDTVNGTGYFERIDIYLARDLKIGKTGHLIENLVIITDILKNSINNSDTKEFIKALKASGIDISSVLKDVKEIIDDPQVKQGIKLTVANAPASIDKTIKNLSSVNKNLEKSNSLIGNSTKKLVTSNSLLHDSTSTLKKSNALVRNSTDNLEKSNSLLSNSNNNLETLNEKLPEIPPDLLKDADKTLKKADCLTNEAIDILSKRFWLFRFLFGNPGNSLKKCKNCNP
jgi:ABC-type transporter Mla subunit MlaD